MYQLAVRGSVALGIFLCIAFVSRTHAADGGIGLMITQLYDSKTDNKAGALIVLHVIEGTPAYERGVQRGDIITHIDKMPTSGKRFEQLVFEELRGPVGSAIVLTITRPPKGQPFDLEIERVAFPSSYGQKE
jgi:carboxyl-terminal processing protease